MSSVQVGQVPPSFRLPSGQGPEIGPDDYRGRRSVIVWFTKGMACPFCRQHMSQLIRGYPSFQGLNAEICEVTPTSPERARYYVRQFNIPFPYLCDPQRRAGRSWGLEARRHSLGWYARAFYAGMRLDPPPSDFGKLEPGFAEIPDLIADEDMGFYILDTTGVVRYSLEGSYNDGKAARRIPSNEEIARALKACEGAPG